VNEGLAVKGNREFWMNHKDNKMKVGDTGSCLHVARRAGTSESIYSTGSYATKGVSVTPLPFLYLSRGTLRDRRSIRGRFVCWIMF
jgi:hypothetical protein